MNDSIKVKGWVRVRCLSAGGEVLWVKQTHNLVVTTGRDYILTNGLVTPALYLGLLNDNPTIAAGDTMASHAGWTEFTAYDEAARQAWTEAGASSGVITNAASPASFTVSTNGSVVAGMFLTTDSTKSGSSGTLISAAAFTGGDETANDGNLLEVTYQLTLSAS